MMHETIGYVTALAGSRLAVHELVCGERYGQRPEMVSALCLALLVSTASVPTPAPAPLPLPPDALKQRQWAHNTTRIAVIQLPAFPACQPEAKSCTVPVTANDVRPLVRAVARAADVGADLLLAPEYHLVNIHLDRDAAGSFVNAAVAAVAAATRDANVYVAVGSWVLWTPGSARVKNAFTNSILVFGRDGSLVGMYNKTHAATGGPPFFWPPLVNDTEAEMVLGRDYPVFDLDFARIGIMTCYDGYFPEPMRALSLKGAEVVLWPNSRGGVIEPDLVSAGSFFNAVHVVAANSANGAGSVMFEHGASGVVAGPCPLTAPGEPPCFLVATLDLHTLRIARKNHRMLHQRRPELARSTVGLAWGTSEFYDNYTG